MSPISKNISRKFNKVRALIIGDVMLDTYIFGSVTRISPEAPVPIVDVQRMESRLGGAANVAMNIKALGAQAVICSVMGNDATGQKLSGLLDENKLDKTNIILSKTRITTEKTRVFSRNHQLLRYDHEMADNLSAGDEKKLLNNISHVIGSGNFNVVILQDYNKGVLTPKVIRFTIELCNKKKIPVTVDPKKRNFFEYKNVTLFKPNLREINEAFKTAIGKNDIIALKEAAKQLNAQLGHQYTLITLSEEGVFVSNHEEHELIPATMRKVADVSGAGDTVLAVASACIASNIGFKQSARLANIAGGLVCTQVGVAPIEREQFFREIVKNSHI